MLLVFGMPYPLSLDPSPVNGRGKKSQSRAPHSIEANDLLLSPVYGRETEREGAQQLHCHPNSFENLDIV